MIRIDPKSAAGDAAPADPHTAAQALLDGQVRMLQRLAEIGMVIAEAAGEAVASGAPFNGDPAMAYARVARAVRMTLALQTRLLKEAPNLDRAEALARSVRADARRTQAHRLVERAIRAASDDREEVETLSSEAWERLHDADEDIAGLGFEEVVARICRDLGVTPPFAQDGAAIAEAAETVALVRKPREGPPPFLADRTCGPRPRPPAPA